MKKILFVDDEPNVLAAFQRQLHKQFPIETALGPEAGLEALKDWHNFAVVVADMRMPKMDGVEFLAQIKDTAPDVVRMMLTGNADQGTAIEAINRGRIFRFLNKPCSTEVLVEAVADGVRQHELIIAERELLEKTLCGSIKVLTDILSVVDPKSFAHAEHLRDRARQVAKAMNLKETWSLEAAVMLSNIGRVTIPPEVTLKLRLGQMLSPRETEMVQRIPTVGANLISQIPRLQEISRIVLYQDKLFNGQGYPEDQVVGHEIPLGARLLKILSDLAEFESKGIPFLDSMSRLRSRAGWYDPDLLETVAALFAPVVQRPPLEIPFSKLLVGHVLCSDIQTRDGILIVVAGHKITPALMERLRNFNDLSGIKEPIRIENPGPF